MKSGVQCLMDIMFGKPLLNNCEYQVSVIVPAYCERDNLPILVPRIAAKFNKAGIHGEILIVDDNSPDSTEQVCGELAINNPLNHFGTTLSGVC